MNEKPRSFGSIVRRMVLALVMVALTAVVGAVVAFALAGWFEGDIDLEYHQTDSLQASVGPTQLQEDLTVYIEKLEYKNSPYTALKVVRYALVNDDTRSLTEPSSFYFLAYSDGGTSAIDANAVVDMSWDPRFKGSTVPLLKRTDDSAIGPGFTVMSAFPGKSQLIVSLILDVDKYPDLASTEIVMAAAAAPASLTEKATEVTRTYSLTFGWILTIILISAISSASVLGLGWMIVNLRIGQYTAGARIWDKMFERLGLGRPLQRYILKDREGK